MAIAFKEWSLVCEALGKGEQSVILRKGGIAEGRSGFGFEHREFYLFPTWFHGQIEKIRKSEIFLPEQAPDSIVISHAASVEWCGRIGDKEIVHRLRDLHVLDDSVVEDRFVYDTGSGSLGGHGIHVAFVRIYRMEPSSVLDMEKGFGGCRSWIEIPDVDAITMISVLSDEEHERRRELFLRHLEGVEGSS